jgi:Gpi18-like mannosyltransferase
MTTGPIAIVSFLSPALTSPAAGEGASAERPRHRASFELALAALVILAIIGSALVWPRVAPVSPDSCEYLLGGASLFAGRGYFDHAGNVQTLFPPFYSVLIGAIAALGVEPVAAARLVTLLASSLTVLPLGLLTRRLFGNAAALSTALLFALLPLRLQISTMVWSESVYLLLIVTAAWLWAIERDRPSRWRAVTAGACLGLAYLTRPEGLVAAAVLLALGACGFGVWKRAALPSLALCAGALAAIALP